MKDSKYSTSDIITRIASFPRAKIAPVYSGKTMAGLIALIREGQFSKDASILFWHTGGQPALFAYGDKIFEE